MPRLCRKLARKFIKFLQARDLFARHWNTANASEVKFESIECIRGIVLQYKPWHEVSILS